MGVERDKVKDKVIDIMCLLCEGTGDLVNGKCPLYQCHAVWDQAEAILSLPEIAVLADDQNLPGVYLYHEARSDMLKAGWKKVV
uniref:Uncharacterized protein n=1 Tax=viral metagenome TaxID=1070528 RepID=A0A6M3XRW7_9ZZZZ